MFGHIGTPHPLWTDMNENITFRHSIADGNKDKPLQVKIARILRVSALHRIQCDGIRNTHVLCHHFNVTFI